MEIYIVVAAMCASLGAVVAQDGQKVAGAMLGLLLGPLGVLIAVFLK